MKKVWYVVNSISKHQIVSNVIFCMWGPAESSESHSLEGCRFLFSFCFCFLLPLVCKEEWTFLNEGNVSRVHVLLCFFLTEKNRDSLLNKSKQSSVLKYKDNSLLYHRQGIRLWTDVNFNIDFYNIFLTQFITF